MDDHRALPPLARARDTVEALTAEHRAPGRGIFWSVAAAAGALLATLPFVHLAVTVRAAGIVRPVEDAVEVRAPAAGLISAVFVQEFARVEKGQPLAEIAAPEIEERLRHLGVRAADLDAVLEDLAVLAPASIATPDAPAPHELRTPLYQQERVQLQAALASAATELRKLERDCHRAEQLHARGLLSEHDLDMARHAVAQREADRAAFRAQTFARWQGERRQYERERDGLHAEVAALREAKALRTVRAAATGDLLGFTGWKPGVFVGEGQSFGSISPHGAMRVEANVRSRDLAKLAAGLSARVEVDAFPATEWGFLSGTVESVARDVQWSGATPIHRVVVRLTPGQPHDAGPPVARLQKGMAATVRVVVGRRSLWHYLTETADRWLDTEPPSRGAASAPPRRHSADAAASIPLPVGAMTASRGHPSEILQP